MLWRFLSRTQVHLIQPGLALGLLLAIGGCAEDPTRHGVINALETEANAIIDAGTNADETTDAGTIVDETTGAVPTAADSFTLPPGCAGGPGAWHAVYNTGPFYDIALAQDGRLAVLQADSIRFYASASAGHPYEGGLALGALSTRLTALTAMATGGWLLREGEWFDSINMVVEFAPPPVRILRIDAAGNLLWQVAAETAFQPSSALALADGGVWLAGRTSSEGQLRRLNATGQVVQTVPWPEVGVAHAAVVRPDGSLCAAGETTPMVPGDAMILRCWSATGQPLWLWKEAIDKYGLAVRLDAWADNRLLVLTRNHLYWSNFDAFAIDPPAAVSTTLAHAFYPEGGNVSWGGQLLVAALPDPDGGIVAVRLETTWQYRGITTSVASLERYGKLGKATGSVVLDAYTESRANGKYQVTVPGLGAKPHAAIRLPDGSTVLAGEVRTTYYDYPPSTGSGWLHGVPPNCP